MTWHETERAAIKTAIEEALKSHIIVIESDTPAQLVDELVNAVQRARKKALADYIENMP